MSQRKEYIGRYRRAGGTKALFIPLELRLDMQEKFGWKDGDYLVIVPQGGLLMIRRLDKSMLATAGPDQRSREA
jgi:hypothetical protein